MDDAPQPSTLEQFTTAATASNDTHTNRRWTLARTTRSGEKPTWLSNFAGNHPTWVASVDEAMIFHHEGVVEAARLRCTALPSHDDVIYAVCSFDKNTDSHGNQVQPIPSFEAGMLNAIRELNASEELRREIAKRIS